jgi:hypothetical protein
MRIDLKNFLVETEYCDINHPNIQKIAKKITKDCNSEREKAISLFYWVRDNIEYRFGSWSIKASDVLFKRYGMCTNKAVLLTSLLRTTKIPSGFGILKVKGQEYFGPIAPPILKQRVSKVSVHIYSYVYLDQKWLIIDSSVDKNLACKTNYFNPTTELSDWDGIHHAIENLDPKHIISDTGPLCNIDDKLNKKPRNSSNLLFFMGNAYLNFLRSNKILIHDTSELEPLFNKWIKKKYFFRYFLYIIYLKFKKLKNKDE